MGISGFLQVFKSLQQPVHIREFAGKVIAVDGNVWLHRGAFSCAYELALQQETTKYVTYFMKMVNVLLYYNVKPLIVFDGKPLPLKSQTAEERKSRSKRALKEGMAHHLRGDRSLADECFRKAITVTPAMRDKVIEALDTAKVPHIIAPFEADAQLTYMVKTNFAEAVLTEDSDLLVFGCEKVILKMNSVGDAILMEHRNFIRAKDINMRGFNEKKIRHMSILSGCDYLPSLPGIGLKTAHKLLQQHNTIDAVLASLRRQGKMSTVPDYEERFRRAEDAFLYQYVFDIARNCVTTLNPTPAGSSERLMDYLGTDPSKESCQSDLASESNPSTNTTSSTSTTQQSTLPTSLSTSLPSSLKSSSSDFKSVDSADDRHSLAQKTVSDLSDDSMRGSIIDSNLSSVSSLGSSHSVTLNHDSASHEETPLSDHSQPQHSRHGDQDASYQSLLSPKFSIQSTSTKRTNNNLTDTDNIKRVRSFEDTENENANTATNVSSQISTSSISTMSLTDSDLAPLANRNPLSHANHTPTPVLQAAFGNTSRLGRSRKRNLQLSRSSRLPRQFSNTDLPLRSRPLPGRRPLQDISSDVFRHTHITDSFVRYDDASFFSEENKENIPENAQLLSDGSKSGKDKKILL